jgi:hypothetical protein
MAKDVPEEPRPHRNPGGFGRSDAGHKGSGRAARGRRPVNVRFDFRGPAGRRLATETRLPSCWSTSKGSKRFFFEKKKQKTFTCFGLRF